MGCATGKLQDRGVECQLAFKDESTPDNPSYAVGGICRIYTKQGVVKINMPPTNLPDASQGLDAWVMLDEDEKSGVAFYANVSRQ